MKRLLFLLPLTLFLLIAALLYRGLFLDPTSLPSPLIGKPFPSFALPELDNPSRTLTPNDIKGRPALINVWATWCTSCREEHQLLAKLADQGVVIYGVNYKDDRTAAQRWLRAASNPYQLNLEDTAGTLGLELGVYGAPETFLIDAHGIIREKYVGIIDQDVWREKLAPVYNELVREARP